MTYKIYLYSDKSSSVISNFSDFMIYPLENDMLIIINKKQKFSVKTGEIFSISNKKYFVFDSHKLTFLFEPSQNKKMTLFFCDFKKIYKNFKFSQYKSAIVLSMIFFYITKLLLVNN